jgi:hypothetical protein
MNFFPIKTMQKNDEREKNNLSFSNYVSKAIAFK